MQNTICIIAVYFGRLPNYFDLWRKSAEYNKSVDFLVITDQRIENLPENIQMVSMSLQEMELLAANKLGISNIKLKSPYKCCDFKPAYGIVFQDFLRQYEYWGHCDLDMILGDLNSFFEKYRLSMYDKFLELGHLTLYRNTDEVNNRFKCSGGKYDYKTVFTTESNLLFDEHYGMIPIYNKNGFSQFTERLFCDIATVHFRYRNISVSRNEKNHRKQVYYWDNGHAYRKWFDRNGGHIEEYLYIHFQKRPNFTLTFDNTQFSGFYITNKGFFPLTKEPDIHSVKKYNRYHPIKEIAETAHFKLKYYRKALKRRLMK